MNESFNNSHIQQVFHKNCFCITVFFYAHIYKCLYVCIFSILFALKWALMRHVWMNSCPPFRYSCLAKACGSNIGAARSSHTHLYSPPRQNHAIHLLCSLAALLLASAFFMCLCMCECVNFVFLLRGIWSSFYVRFVFVLVLSALLIGFRISSNQRYNLMGRERRSYKAMLYLYFKYWR